MNLEQFNKCSRLRVDKTKLNPDDFKLIQVDFEISDILEMIGCKTNYPYLLVYAVNGEMLRVYGLQSPGFESQLIKLK